VLQEWQPFGRHDRHLDRPRAASLERLVPGVVRGLGLEQRLHQSQLFFLWTQIVGEDIARHAQPVSLKNAFLVVAVDHPVWLQELERFHKPMILQKIQARVGKQTVKQIVFRIG
jgi:predicted nucleic acid-binding Zn ribbon protein